MASASGYRSLGTDPFFMVLPIKKQKAGSYLYKGSVHNTILKAYISKAAVQ